MSPMSPASGRGSAVIDPRAWAAVRKLARMPARMKPCRGASTGRARSRSGPEYCHPILSRRPSFVPLVVAEYVRRRPRFVKRLRSASPRSLLYHRTWKLALAHTNLVWSFVVVRLDFVALRVLSFLPCRGHEGRGESHLDGSTVHPGNIPRRFGYCTVPSIDILLH